MINFDKIKKILSSSSIQFYTYTPKSNKPKNLILKRIQGNYSESEITDELKEYNIPNVNITKVAKIYFNKSKNPDFHHYLVQLTPVSDTIALKKIKYLANQKIRWENFKRKDIFQCKNCQRVGQTSACCNLTYRCVKCTKSHDPGKCDIVTNSDKSALECVNCGQKGHPASFKGCPFLKYSQKKITSVIKIN